MKSPIEQLRRAVGRIRPSPRVPYQGKRAPVEKFAKIDPVLRQECVRSVLDVGCNAGVITRLAGAAGYFAVGIDQRINTYGINAPLDRACLGEISFDRSVAETLPSFDAILLLSVYHQWVRNQGHDEARHLLAALYEKAEKVLVVELSGRASKYGFEPGQHFQDQDDESIVAHWSSYLADALPGSEVNYFGKSTEKPPREPFRYLFSVH